MIVASAMFVLKTIVAWIRSVQYDNERKVRETEHRVRRETYDKARLEALEKFEDKIEKSIED